jgi:hypothetical protein
VKVHEAVPVPTPVLVTATAAHDEMTELLAEKATEPSVKSASPAVSATDAVTVTGTPAAAVLDTPDESTTVVGSGVLVYERVP